MAEEANGSAATRADEIAELKRQMEEMQKRLEQLSNVADDEAAADEEVAADEAIGDEADLADVAWKAETGESEEHVDVADELESQADMAEEACAIDAAVDEAATAEDEEAEASQAGAAADCLEAVVPAAEELAAGSAEAGDDAAKEDDILAGYAGVPAKITIGEEAAIAVEPVPAASDAVSSVEEAAGNPAPASPYATKETDEEYTAAAVADFMPQSEPPQPAPPVYGAPSGYAPQPGQPGPYAQQQAQQPPVSPYGQQPYAQQPGQTAYYQQNADYYSAPQGGYAQPQGGYQSQYQQPLVRTKDHVAAGLLAIFLGVFGVHKFYLGYNTAGFILLGVTILGGIFTLGIASSVVWLIGIIEGVIYLTKSQPEFEQIYIFNKREWF